jgi:thiol-disulfide isomerase/thioredoxin
MRRLFMVSSLAVVLAGGAFLVPAARAQDGKADQILKDLGKVEVPRFDQAKRNDSAAVQAFLKSRQEVMARRSDLIGQLLKVDPANAKLPELLPERVSALVMSGPKGADAAKDELQQLAATSKDAKLGTEAAYWLTILSLRSQKGDAKSMLKEVDKFIKMAPKDERGAILIYSVANQVRDDKEQTELHKRVVKEYPESRIAKMVEGSLHQKEAVGKPFELEFSDAIKGTTVSMKGLRGKVVVIDFWATWCGPCVAEMPNMKKLYAEYKPKGVEFIGVSLDESKETGGLDKLKEFVAKNEITWPQYYQGKGWESDFSRGWGINSIPAVFVVDPEGKLHSVNARGKLDEMISALLKKAKSGGAGAGAGAGGQ